MATAAAVVRVGPQIDAASAIPGLWTAPVAEGALAALGGAAPAGPTLAAVSLPPARPGAAPAAAAAVVDIAAEVDDLPLPRARRAPAAELPVWVVDLVDQSVAVLVHPVGITDLDGPGVDLWGVVAAVDTSDKPVTVVVGAAGLVTVAILSHAVAAAIGSAWKNVLVAVVAVVAGGEPVAVLILVVALEIALVGRVRRRAVVVHSIADLFLWTYFPLADRTPLPFLANVKTFLANPKVGTALLLLSLYAKTGTLIHFPVAVVIEVVVAVFRTSRIHLGVAVIAVFPWSPAVLVLVQKGASPVLAHLGLLALTRTLTLKAIDRCIATAGVASLQGQRQQKQPDQQPPLSANQTQAAVHPSFSLGKFVPILAEPLYNKRITIKSRAGQPANNSEKSYAIEARLQKVTPQKTRHRRDE